MGLGRESVKLVNTPRISGDELKDILSSVSGLALIIQIQTQISCAREMKPRRLGVFKNTKSWNLHGHCCCPHSNAYVQQEKHFFSFLDDEEDPALEHPLFSPKYIGKMTFIIFSDFLSSVIRQNGFLSSDINQSDQNGSFDTHIAILCAI